MLKKRFDFVALALLLGYLTNLILAFEGYRAESCEQPIMSVEKVFPLGFVWDTADPFLFCVHHLDDFPEGNGKLGPNAPLNNRNLGQDFGNKDWNMYHGRTIPGFPSHPHCGFETITVVQKGLVDHTDSLGASGRYGEGDTQWMTAGGGVQHAEMFPLLKTDEKNTMELFQIWINLPKKDKFADPDYVMLWAEDTPTVTLKDEKGSIIRVKLVSGELNGTQPPKPPKASWASDENNHVWVWIIDMEADATWKLPTLDEDVNRRLFIFESQDKISIDGQHELETNQGVVLNPRVETVLQNGNGLTRMLLLQGRPIKEPVAHRGPFVMNEQAELFEAFSRYQRTEFGGWPWPRSDMTHGDDPKRFAKFADGRTEYPSS